MHKITLTSPRTAVICDRGICPVQDALDYIAIDINRLHRISPSIMDRQFVHDLYQQTVGAINLLNHLTGYSEQFEDARAEAAIAYRKAINAIERGASNV